MNNTEKSTRGGARPGAGRKPLTSAERAAAARNICRKTIDLTPDDLAAIESCAKLSGLSVHAWMVAAVRSALETPQAVVNPIEKPAGCP